MPAKTIKKRFDEKTIERLLNLKWWEYDQIIFKGIDYTNDVLKAVERLEERVEAGVNKLVLDSYIVSPSKRKIWHIDSKNEEKNIIYFNGKMSPSPITGLIITRKTEDALCLKWNKNSEASGYIVELYKNEAWIRIARIAENNTVTYNVKGLNVSTSYRFRVKVFSFVGNTPLYSSYQYVNRTTNSKKA